MPVPEDYDGRPGAYRDYIVDPSRDGELLSPPAAARLLDVSDETVRQLVEGGSLPARRGLQPVRRRIHIPRWAVVGRARLGNVANAPSADAVTEPRAADARPTSEQSPEESPSPSELRNTAARGESAQNGEAPDHGEELLRVQALVENLLDRMLAQSATRAQRAKAAAIAAKVSADEAADTHAELELLVRQLRAEENRSSAALPIDLARLLGPEP